MRILAVDYGERRTGLAVSDEMGITAQGLDTLMCATEEEIPSEVVRIAGELGVDRIILGLPLNMNGSESEKSLKVRKFGETIGQQLNVPVIFWDERMSSLQAQRVMHELGVKLKSRKKTVDRISATLMLQEYLKTIP
ncbi:MAG: Holliday junction resolvase RuvX [Candidatus Latescibacteria bacterium]|nr:Holliday junction resolvase RuvX [Candidatus Latescibacterota bacterium]